MLLKYRQFIWDTSDVFQIILWLDAPEVPNVKSSRLGLSPLWPKSEWLKDNGTWWDVSGRETQRKRIVADWNSVRKE